MQVVTVSSKYQVVIPKEIRKQIDLKVGTSLEVISYGSRIELIPIQPIRKLKGSLKGLNTSISRDDDRI